jgi:excisionase family DNA binding protein
MATVAYAVALQEEERVKDLYRSLLGAEAAVLIGPDQVKHELPESVHRVLVDILSQMQEGKAVAIVPLMQELTTKRAADILGVSRQYLVRLLDEGKIRYHRTGTHRRIYLKDVLEYRDLRDQERHAAIRRMARQEVEDGTYDTFVPTEE